MMSEIGEDLRKLLLAGLGAAATTAEKSREMVDELVRKGEITLEQGKVLNEELKRNVEGQVKKHVTVTVTQPMPADVQSVKEAVAKLSDADLERVKAAIAELERVRQPGTDGQEENAAE
jgi:polyhydroxyalkanoate synthesis regulator phasin